MFRHAGRTSIINLVGQKYSEGYEQVLEALHLRKSSLRVSGVK